MLTSMTKIAVAAAVASALSGCYVGGGGSVPLDSDNPYGPRLGGSVYGNPESGAVSSSVNLHTGTYWVK